MSQATPQTAFRALADPTRRDILLMLRDKNMTIAQITDNFTMTRAAVKKHLTVLSGGGLIQVQVKGRTRINQINPAGMAPVLDWLGFFDVFWDDRLTALKSTIEKDASND